MGLEEKLKKRLYVRLFSHWATLYPFGLGVIALMVGIAIGKEVPAFLGLVGMLAGIAHLLWEWTCRIDAIAKEEEKEQRREEEWEKSADLDDLDSRLRRDKDTVPEKLLERLRELREVLARETEGGNHTASAVKGEVEQLFRASISSLEQTIQLHELAKRQSGALKRRTQERREQLKEEINKNVETLEAVVSGVCRLDGDQDGNQESLRRELDAKLKAAQAADQKLQELRERISRETQ